MKKILGIVFAAVLACASLSVLAGCGGGGGSNSAQGKWVCAAVDDGTGIIEIADYEEILGMTGEDMFTLMLNEDGTVGFTVFGEDQTASLGGSITWEDSANGVTLKGGDQTLELTYDDGRLVMEVDGQKVYFERG
ncbi:MAG: hypothetical protein IKE61_01965 [Coriobacteriales bacterium]|nr:hypothetical protein [Coriobacteriales bacterium]